MEGGLMLVAMRWRVVNSATSQTQLSLERAGGMLSNEVLADP